MFTAYVTVTLLAAGLNAYAAYVDFARAEWVIANMTRYGIPHSWIFSLGAIKAIGAVGLVIGIGVPQIGVAASLGLVLYFMGAIFTVACSKWYSHLRYPAPFFLVAIASLVLRLTTLR
jgi:DoxX-like family